MHMENIPGIVMLVFLLSTGWRYGQMFYVYIDQVSLRLLCHSV